MREYAKERKKKTKPNIKTERVRERISKQNQVKGIYKR